VTPRRTRGYKEGGVAQVAFGLHVDPLEELMVGRYSRASAAVSLLCCSLPALAPAQVTLGTGVRALTSGAPGREGWRANQVVASAFRFDRPWLAFGSDGAVLRDERGAWRGTGSLETAVLARGPGDGRLAIVGSLGEPARDSTLYRSRAVVGARLSRRVGAWGTWLAADAARPAGSNAPPTADFTSGAWRQLGSALVTVSLSSRAFAARGSSLQTNAVALPDSVSDSLGVPVPHPSHGVAQDSVTGLVARRWSEAEGRLFWAGGRWSLDVAIRGRLAAAGVRAAMWATADAAWLLGPRLALVGGVGTAPSGPSPYMPAHRHASIGLRLMRSTSLGRPLPVELQPVAVAFEVQEVGAGVYRVATRVPRARAVEVTGDFTAWKPVALHRGSGDWWEVTVPMTPGTHQINLRINGERWVAPPGATVIDDDFAGVVGVIVVR
jgi:hypothetical protein